MTEVANILKMQNGRVGLSESELRLLAMRICPHGGRLGQTIGLADGFIDRLSWFEFLQSVPLSTKGLTRLLDRYGEILGPEPYVDLTGESELDVASHKINPAGRTKAMAPDVYKGMVTLHLHLHLIYYYLFIFLHLHLHLYYYYFFFHLHLHLHI
jgi:hypothetical protein